MSGIIPGFSVNSTFYAIYWIENGGVFGSTANAALWNVTRNADGDYTVTHNLGLLAYEYAAWGSIQSVAPSSASYTISQSSFNVTNVQTYDSAGTPADFSFAFVLMPFA